MLRVALPNKGSLAAPASEMFREAGYRQNGSGRELVLQDPANDTEFFFLRPRDIATYVGDGQLDVGVTGRDLLLDGDGHAEEVLALGFGRSTFRFAGPPDGVSGLDALRGRRVATAYVGLVRRHLEERGVDAEVVRLDGAVETAVQLGVADVIADVVSTGTTLAQAGLEVFGDPILASEAVLIRRAGRSATAAEQQLGRRLQGVIIARQYVMVDYDVETQHVEAACAITPGIESPTISPLHREGWVAVRAMVERAHAHHVMDELYELGARGILVTEIHACRL